MGIQTIGVAGLGLLGRGIAACLLAHGFRVVGYTRKAATHQKAREYIRRAIAELIEHAGFPAELTEEWSTRYQAVDGVEPFADCDFVIESIIEDMQIKQEFFDDLEAVVRPEVPIASNTSSLPITSIQRNRQQPERFLGMHWAEPSHITRFMELIRGEQTSEATLQATLTLARAIGKEPCVVQKDVPAFIANRLAYVMYREAAHLLEMGVADVETIDRSYRKRLRSLVHHVRAFPLDGPDRWPCPLRSGDCPRLAQLLQLGRVA